MGNFKSNATQSFIRDWILKGEGRLTVMQFFGFMLVLLGVICFATFLILDMFNASAAPRHYSTGIALAFFATMLGVAFAYPDMLKGQTKDISTMRIIVFMFANVICMLLLKIGWEKDSLAEIGLDANWMGVIAFLFGAKATQTYFERKSKNTTTPTDENETAAGQPAAPETAVPESLLKTATDQFRQLQLEGVVGVGKWVRNNNGQMETGVQLNVNDKTYMQKYSMPFSLKRPDGTAMPVTPRVIYVGIPKTHRGVAGSGITNSNGINGCGTIGCIVEIPEAPGKKYILSCQHVLNYDHDFNKMSRFTEIAFFGSPGKIATHTQGIRTDEIDAGLAEIEDDRDFTNSNIGNIGAARTIGVPDLDETVQVTLTGYDLDEKTVKTNKGVIVNNEFYAEFEYAGQVGKFGIKDLIVISNKEGDTYNSISKPGYSGALVIDSAKRPIGLVVGGDLNYSYAIPIGKILTHFNCTII